MIFHEQTQNRTSGHEPRVSVLMPVYNGAPFLREAIESILSQTFTDFEFIIVDDGSTDETPEILGSYSDPRIRLLHHETNQGLTASLNDGLAVARGQLIARQDADDISLPQRLAVQVAFMEAYPEMGLIGSARIRISEDGTDLHTSAPETDNLKLKWLLLFRNQFTHTAVMFRRELAEAAGRYRRDEYPSDDYGLWSRMAKRAKLANISEPLVKYRIRCGSITRHPDSIMRKTSLRVRLKNIRDLVDSHVSMDAVRLLQMFERGEARNVPIEELQRKAATIFPILRRETIPRLLNRFCEVHHLHGRAKRAFQKWARADFGRSVLSVINAHIDEANRPLKRSALAWLFAESLKLQPGLVFDVFAMRVLLKGCLGAPLMKAAKRMRGAF
ncbi:MAG: glycosyltransferase [Acidobacteria bacterium]|nr:glycosyltransferase [Acidobacteriota bacterium]